VFLLCYLCLEKRREKFRSEVFISQDQTKLERIEHLSLKSKLRNTCAFLPKLLQMVLCFTFNDLVVSGVTTTIAFKNSLITPADHYKYYLVASFGGLLVGRSYLGVVEFIKPGLADKILINRNWVFLVLSTGHVVFFVLASLFRFLPNMELTMFLVFTLGFCAEAIYANVSVILGELEDYRLREFVLGLSVYGVGLGNLVGSILSGLVEKALVQHCKETTNDTSLCFTRKFKISHKWS
jgi:MFS family permease